MKHSDLIKIIQEQLDSLTSNNPIKFKIYDTFSEEDEIKDINKVNGSSKITAGSFDNVPKLNKSEVTTKIVFNYPVERFKYVSDILESLAKNSVGLIISNQDINPQEFGYTEVFIHYDIKSSPESTTLGKTISSTILCFFTINDKNVLSNQCKAEILNDEGEYEEILFNVLDINVNRETDSDNYANSKEKESFNKSQFLSLDFSLPSVRGSMINKIKNDIINLNNLNKAYTIKYTDELGEHIYENMIATGQFKLRNQRGADVGFNISFVKKRGE